MKWIAIFLLTTTFVFSQNLDQHRWNNRVVVISADQSNERLLEAQLQALMTHRKGLKDRKLVFYVSINNTCKFYNLKDKPVLVSCNEPPRGFQFLLYGLDGNEKFKSRDLVSSDELFALIDKMPMRRQEMKLKKN